MIGIVLPIVTVNAVIVKNYRTNFVNVMCIFSQDNHIFPCSTELVLLSQMGRLNETGAYDYGTIYRWSV